MKTSIKEKLILFGSWSVLIAISITLWLGVMVWVEKALAVYNALG